MKLNSIKYFYPEKPVLILMESDAYRNLESDPDKVAEPKINGSRCEIHMLDGHIEFWDRHGKHLKWNSDPLHEKARENIKNILREKLGTKGYFVLDSELRHNKVEGIQNKIIIYDIHVYKNVVLNRLTFKERRDILEKHFDIMAYGDNLPVILIEQFSENWDALMIGAKYCDELEGIVIKSLKGKLKLGRSAGANSIWMFKVRVASGRYRY